MKPIIRAMQFTPLLFLLAISCKKDNSNCQSDPTLRKGAWCMDGTRTNTTDSNTCLGYGGVREWICK